MFVFLNSLFWWYAFVYFIWIAFSWESIFKLSIFVTWLMFSDFHVKGFSALFENTVFHLRRANPYISHPINYWKNFPKTVDCWCLGDICWRIFKAWTINPLRRGRFNPSNCNSVEWYFFRKVLEASSVDGNEVASNLYTKNIFCF